MKETISIRMGEFPSKQVAYITFMLWICVTECTQCFENMTVIDGAVIMQCSIGGGRSLGGVGVVHFDMFWRKSVKICVSALILRMCEYI